MVKERKKKELEGDVRSRCDSFIGCRCVYKGILRGQCDVDLLMVKNGNYILGQFFFTRIVIEILVSRVSAPGFLFIFNFTPSIMEKYGAVRILF